MMTPPRLPPYNFGKDCPIKYLAPSSVYLFGGILTAHPELQGSRSRISSIGWSAHAELTGGSMVQS